MKLKIKLSVEKTSYIFLVLIFLAAFSIRFYGMMDVLMQEDGASYLTRAIYTKADPKWIWKMYMSDPYWIITGNTGQVYLMSFFMNFFQTPEFAGKMVSVLFGSLTIVVVFFIAKELHVVKAGLFAAGLIAFSPINVFYSKLMYADVLLGFFISLTVLFFIKAIKYKEVPKKVTEVKQETNL